MDCLVSSWKVNCPSLYFTIIHLEVCESLPISKNLTARKQSHPEADMTLWFQSNVKKHKNVNISVKSNKKPTLVFKIFFLQIINFLTDFELRRWKRERGGGLSMILKIFFLPKHIYAKYLLWKELMKNLLEEIINISSFIIWMNDRNTMAVGRHP